MGQSLDIEARDGAAQESCSSPRVLFLSRNYPSSALPYLGLWVEGLAIHAGSNRDRKVVAPVPYCPNLPFLSENYLRYRRVPKVEYRNGIEIHHPRILVPPGTRARSLEGSLYLAGVEKEIDRLFHEFGFDIIHAHFTYPDGWVAAQIAKKYDVPMIITEHASWKAWANHSPVVFKQACTALDVAQYHVSVGTALREELEVYASNPDKLKVIPCGVDGNIFHLPTRDSAKHKNQILFVGAVRHVKGVDVLIRALNSLAEQNRQTELLIVGDAYYSAYAQTQSDLERLAENLGVSHQIKFLPGRDPPEIAQLMRESALLVLPSRRETLGMVLVEALSCGTPVVATRCGGPQDIVEEGSGILTPVEDHDALAEAIAFVLDNPSRYAPEQLRETALAKFSGSIVASQYQELYRQAVGLP